MPLTEDEKKELIEALGLLSDKFRVGIFIGILKEGETEIVFTGNLCPVCTNEILSELIADGVIKHTGEHEDVTVH